MRYLTNTIILLVFFECSIGQKIQDKATAFIFKGNIVGQDSGYVHLSYTNLNGKYINDSVLLNKGAFRFQGNIIEPTIAEFHGKIKSKNVADPNTTDLYLEPATIEGVFNIDNFKNAVFKGSKTQQEYIVYYQKYSVLEKKREPIYLALKNARLKNDTNRIKQIYFNDFSKYKIQNDSLIFSFIKQNNNSFVSVNLLEEESQRISTDSLKFFYLHLSNTLQESKKGVKIKGFIKKAESLNIGMQAPLFTATDLNNKRISLIEFRGKYVFLDFWASYCSPCRAQHPNLKQAYSKFHNNGLEIIGISLDHQDKKDWLEALKNDSLPWIQLCDFKGWYGELVNTYNLFRKGIPSNFLIDPKGVIVAKDLSGEELSNRLNSLIK